jgi:arylsulfatase A-like enzyme
LNKTYFKKINIMNYVGTHHYQKFAVLFRLYRNKIGIGMKTGGERLKRPNFLILLCDEERYPPVYEGSELAAWRKKNLITQELLRQNGICFTSHYAAATACSPSRASLFTGQYPSLHGVTQTTGIAKEAFDPDVFWLPAGTVPTMGNYFRAAGYRTFYKGKWHVSDEDLITPATHQAIPSYHPHNGTPYLLNEQLYLKGNRLDPFGFTGWVGPEPHGKNPRNSGSSARGGISGRDEVFATQAVELIHQLDQDPSETPWLFVASFVNPHDITLFGSITEIDPLFHFQVDETVPLIDSPPTLHESLRTKPRCQRSYRKTYPRALQPSRNTTFYRQLYYQLQKNVDAQMFRVFEALQNSSFYENTIVIFTSDHGELLGAHGGLHQKWYCSYEEATHVPLILHHPTLFTGRQSVEMLTSHIDLLPTLLGLAGANVPELQDNLRQDHAEVHPLVGRDLSALILDQGTQARAWEPLYFMTDDDPTRGLNQKSALGQSYQSVSQPNHIETVIAAFQSEKGVEIWKYSRYYDNPQFWSNPGKQDVVLHQEDVPNSHVGQQFQTFVCQSTVKTKPLSDEYEMYHLTNDPLETRNLAHPNFSTAESRMMERILANLLAQQRRQKRLSPKSGPVPGMPS